MRNILISIKPQYVCKILNKEKILEIRKSIPKCKLPCKVYIYCTKGKYCKESLYLADDNKYDIDYYVPSDDNFVLNGKVVAEFTLNNVEKIHCCDVPYRKTNNLGYEYFIDNGVYQLKDDYGLVFERDDTKLDTMLKNKDLKKIQLKPIDIYNYLNGYGKFYAWQIDDLKIYDKPKELSEFEKYGSYKIITDCYKKQHGLCNKGYGMKGNYVGCEKARIKKPPQSYCFVEELEEK